MATAFVEILETSRDSCYYLRGSFHEGSFTEVVHTPSMEAVEASMDSSMETSEYFQGSLYRFCSFREGFYPLQWKWPKLPWT